VCGFFPKRVKNESIVPPVSVDPSESSMLVISSREIVLVSSVSYCFRYCRQKRCRSSEYGWYLAL
jgi:hypothetical protein